MKFRFLLLLVLFSFISFIAQKKDFSTEDVVLNSYSILAPENLQKLNWFLDLNKYFWIEKDAILFEDVDGQKDKLTLDKINQILVSKGFEKLYSLHSLYSLSKEEVSFSESNRFVKIQPYLGNVTEIQFSNNEFDSWEISKNQEFAVANLKNNIWFVDQFNSFPITNEENLDIISGQTISRNEFGISGGIFFSPNNQKIAFYQKDVSNVTDYPIIDFTDVANRPAKLQNIKYPMNGMPSEILKIGVFDVKTKNVIFLNTNGEKEQYLTSVTWSPDEKYLFVAHLNRLQNHLKLFKYNVLTGEQEKLLFEEKSEKYVEPETPLYFLPGSNDKFLWFSERNNWNHLYLYDTDGNLIKQVTNGDWIVQSIDKMISNNEFVITATKDSPIEKKQYLVNIRNENISRIVKENGTHNLLFSENGKYFIDKFSSFTTPREITLNKLSGDIVKTLLNSKNPLENYNLGKQKTFTLKASDGNDLFSRLIYPVNFDSTKKYPVIFYVYGGPHVQLIQNTFTFGRYDLWFHQMAQKGYFIFTIDNRGSDNRGLQFEQATWHRNGSIEVEDQLVGVNYLKSLSYIDSERFGVFGWSYGGFMTTSLMLRSNNAFKVGVAGGAVIDWRFYEIMYGERYMGTEVTNKVGMEETSLLNYIPNLNGKLLLVHGTSDDVVVWQQTLSFLAKATTLNKRVDYYPYIGSKHGVGGKDALNLYQKITEYFLENL